MLGRGVSGWGGQGGCDKELKFLGKFTNKNFGGRGSVAEEGSGGGGGLVGGSGWM